jgi:hypothetical protein
MRKSRKMRWAGHVACLGGNRHTYLNAIQWSYSHKFFFTETDSDVIDWNDVVQNRAYWRAFLKTGNDRR